MNNEDIITIQDLEHSIQQWEESVERIAKGWDCIEEYTHNLFAREVLDERLLHFSSKNSPIEPLLRRIAIADDSFRNVTVASRLCVWHCDPQFRYYPDGKVELLFKSYDQKTYWYYYRWQPDCPYPWKEHDGYSYQKDLYGLDFENMTVSELKDAAGHGAAHMIEELRKQKSRTR